MLRGLSITDILLIDRLELEFQPGLNVLTGETGAGKSILLDSLGFVLGWRGRADLVRKGAEKGEVTASFELAAGHPAHKLLEDLGLPSAEDELLLRRANARDGRKTAYVNDRRCSGEALRALAECLVELHGQQDDGGLLNPRGHRDLLDVYCGANGGETRTRWRSLRKAKDDLILVQRALEQAAKDTDYLRHAVEELDNLAPVPGEDAELDARRRLMQAAERIRADIVKAGTALGPEMAESAIADAGRWLGGVADRAEGRLDEPIAALSRAYAELSEAQQGIETCLQQLDFDPFELEAVEERLFAIRALARKHNVQPEGLPTLAEDLRQRLNAIESGADQIAELHKKVEQAQGSYLAAAQKLSGQRSKAAARLDKAMAKELAPLKMERAVFSTQIVPSDPGPKGTDDVVFQVVTNPGSPAGPINRIASGGELSRFLLALKVCLTERSSGLTLIFDEIDRGVGGATADAVGRRLADLSEQAQILVVTHSPQVAAQGRHQWQVSKSSIGDDTRSLVRMLEGEARVAEIARMLSGDVVTSEALAAAQVLLKR
ncbi:MAG: DNA repair protein RecN [Rhodobacteraceae bacterium]|nr:DNA repair protein RecN [Paracoccaceae bacterium]